MPPVVDLSGLIAAVTTGFSNLTEQTERVANALYVDPTEDEESIASLAEAGNAQVGSVIDEYSDGPRVKVYNETPAP